MKNKTHGEEGDLGIKVVTLTKIQKKDRER